MAAELSAARAGEVSTGQDTDLDGCAFRPRLAIEMVLPSLAAAGMEVMTSALARGLGARGHRVGITCIEERGDLADSLTRDGIRVSLVPCPGLLPNFVPHPALRDHLARLALDTVHSHSGAWAKSAVAARAARIPGVCHTEHGFRHLEPVYEPALFWWAGRHTDRVIGVAHEVTDRLVASARIPRGRCVTLANGIDTQRFSPGRRSGALRGRSGIPADALLVGCVARFDPIKNHALLLDAFARVRRAVPTARLVLAGDGELRSEMEKKAVALGIVDSVAFIGVVADTAPIYRDLDVFALASSNEGTSISVLEALASGVAVVATAVGGTPRLLDGGRCGELVPSGDTDSFAAALLRLLKDPVHRTRLGEAGRNRALRDYDERAMVSAYERIYYQIGSRPDRLLRADGAS